jgi:F0F1-type ATP synthase assembly protein I
LAGFTLCRSTIAVANLPEDRSPLSAALARASLVTTIAIEMVVPIVAGYFLDQWLGTRFVFVAVGAVLGFVAGIRGLVSLAQASHGNGGPDEVHGKRPPDGAP